MKEIFVLEKILNILDVFSKYKKQGIETEQIPDMIRGLLGGTISPHVEIEAPENNIMRMGYQYKIALRLKMELRDLKNTNLEMDECLKISQIILEDLFPLEKGKIVLSNETPTIPLPEKETKGL